MKYAMHIRKNEQGVIVDDLGAPVPPADPAYLAWLAEGNAPEVLVLPLTSPNEVPLWAVHAALREAGMFAAVDAAVLSVEKSHPAIFAAWTMGNYAVRTSPLVTGMAQTLGITDAEIDAVFVRASQIAQD